MCRVHVSYSIVPSLSLLVVYQVTKTLTGTCLASSPDPPPPPPLSPKERPGTHCLCVQKIFRYIFCFIHLDIVVNFQGRKLCELVKNTIFVDCSLLQCQRTPCPKFCGENFRV